MNINPKSKKKYMKKINLIFPDSDAGGPKKYLKFARL